MKLPVKMTINGQSYSYARFMADEGYALLAIDQLGTGESSKPDGDFVTLDETALSLHQVLTQMRSGNNPLAYAFQQIVLVGHSFGSINSIDPNLKVPVVYNYNLTLERQMPWGLFLRLAYTGNLQRHLLRDHPTQREAEHIASLRSEPV